MQRKIFSLLIIFFLFLTLPGCGLLEDYKKELDEKARQELLNALDPDHPAVRYDAENHVAVCKCGQKIYTDLSYDEFSRLITDIGKAPNIGNGLKRLWWGFADFISEIGINLGKGKKEAVISAWVEYVLYNSSLCSDDNLDKKIDCLTSYLLRDDYTTLAQLALGMLALGADKAEYVLSHNDPGDIDADPRSIDEWMKEDPIPDYSDPSSWLGFISDLLSFASDLIGYCQYLDSIQGQITMQNQFEKMEPMLHDLNSLMNYVYNNPVMVVYNVYFKASLTAIEQELEIVSKGEYVLSVSRFLNDAILNGQPKIPAKLTEAAGTNSGIYVTQFDPNTWRENWSKGPSLAELAEMKLSPEVVKGIFPYIEFRVEYEFGDLKTNLRDAIEQYNKSNIGSGAN